MDDGQFLAQVLAQQAHQEIDFRLGPAPVFQRKRIQRKRGNAQPRARLDHGPRRLHAGAMAGDARQMPPLRPAAVAVHDDGDVLGQPLRVESSRRASSRLAGCEQVRWLDVSSEFRAGAATYKLRGTSPALYTAKLTQRPWPRNRAGAARRYSKPGSTLAAEGWKTAK